MSQSVRLVFGCTKASLCRDTEVHRFFVQDFCHTGVWICNWPPTQKKRRKKKKKETDLHSCNYSLFICAKLIENLFFVFLLFTGPERFPSSSADTYLMAVLRTGHWMNFLSLTNAGGMLLCAGTTFFYEKIKCFTLSALSGLQSTQPSQLEGWCAVLVCGVLRSNSSMSEASHFRTLKVNVLT